MWKNARLLGTKPGIKPLLLRDVRPFINRLNAFREQTLARTKDYLTTLAGAYLAKDKTPITELATRNQLDSEVLNAWLDYLSLPSGRRRWAAEPSCGPTYRKCDKN